MIAYGVDDGALTVSILGVFCGGQNYEEVLSIERED